MKPKMIIAKDWDHPMLREHLEGANEAAEQMGIGVIARLTVYIAGTCLGQTLVLAGATHPNGDITERPSPGQLAEVVHEIGHTISDQVATLMQNSLEINYPKGPAH